jgi:hypothetical protein
VSIVVWVILAQAIPAREKVSIDRNSFSMRGFDLVHTPENTG